MNRHRFQQAARQFRAGKLSLDEFTSRVFPQPESAAPSADPARLPALPVRRAESHKHDYGHVAVIAGSRGMAGAAALAGMAALRGGAGLVTVATPASCQDVVAGFHPALMTAGLAEDGEGRIALSRLSGLPQSVVNADCLAVGPGLGQSPALQSLLGQIWREAPQTAVLDADGLNNLSGFAPDPGPAGGPRILTPHPGEFRRLFPVAGDPADRAALAALAVDRAAAWNAVLVLKGHHSLVTDGRQQITNRTGNPGMATAGSGDVLTGLVAAITAQGLSAWEAAVLGCHWHGVAGDRAARQHGQAGLLATDIIHCLTD